jgi:nucleotide-binding universal stress UspA family protein
MTALPQRILVAVDGSDSAGRAARFGVALAERLGASVTLIHVHVPTGLETLGLRALTSEEIEEAKVRLSREALEAAMRAVGPTSVAVHHALAMGDPAEQVLTRARQDDVDLIVMGRRGLSPMGEWLLGSVSSRVVHHAPCAVTLVR